MDFDAWCKSVERFIHQKHPNVPLFKVDTATLRDAYAAGMSPHDFASQPTLPFRQLDPQSPRVPSHPLSAAIAWVIMLQVVAILILLWLCNFASAIKDDVDAPRRITSSPY